MSKKVRRLFAGFAPKHYIIELDPNRDSLKLTGSVIIAGQKTGRPGQRLTFHQHGLKITTAHVIKNDKKGDREIAIARINHHDGFDEVRLHAEEMLYPGQYTVRMEFEGVITRPMDGIYPCFFKQDGKEKRLLATQFESHHARDAFPCIDEPEAKATFALTLTTPAGETVLGNTPVKKQATKDGRLVTTFETTPRMSTYLLAFAYGELGYQEATTKHGVVVRTYATRDNAPHTGFALDVAVKSLEFFNDYYEIPYPLQKCDLIALPDFASGAMENWGLITFREQGLVVDPKHTSLPVKQYVAMVVAHELAHQWFGNLVTMKWWNDLWLNEGFASWMATLAVDKLFPDWQYWTQFIADDQQYALKLDALQNTHPIESTINHPDEIRTIFDAISYEKGASCIHMLANYLGAETFRQGLSYYLKKHAYGNATTMDLWDALETVSGKPIKNFMAAWTSQAGYPLIHATVEENRAHLVQETFLVNPKNREQARSDKTQMIWPIGLEPNQDISELFDSEEATLELSEIDKPLILNSEHSGFYRVVYNASHLELLGDLIRRGQIGPLDRLGMLSDIFEAAKAGYLGTTDALTFLKSYQTEDNNAVWDIIASNLSSIRTIMDEEQLREESKPYSQKLVSSQLQRLGWAPKKGESHFDKLLRPTILGMAAIADEPSVLKEIAERFAAAQRPEDIAPDIRGVIYTTAARKGDAQTFERLLTLHNQSTSSEERNTLAAALTNFKQPELVARSLELITSDNVRLQDVVYWVAYSFMNRYARQAAWEWTVKNWDWLDKQLGTDLGFSRLPIYIARTMSNEKSLATFKSLL
jgi:aminopeptidase N